jgi:hypothetical protein
MRVYFTSGRMLDGRGGSIERGSVLVKVVSLLPRMRQIPVRVINPPPPWALTMDLQFSPVLAYWRTFGLKEVRTHVRASGRCRTGRRSTGDSEEVQRG